MQAANVQTAVELTSLTGTKSVTLGTRNPAAAKMLSRARRLGT
jgi:hypothetical protein